MTWRKSTRSAEDGNCVEIRGDLQALRDSKAPDTVMQVSRMTMNNFIAVLRTR